MLPTILALNVGSSSVKFAVAHGRKIFLRGHIDHFGHQAGIRLWSGRRQTFRHIAISGPDSAFGVMYKILLRLKIVPDMIAHRIVHGGQKFTKPSKLTPTALKYLHSLIALAPLHQPISLMGINFTKQHWPRAVTWGVFDTALYRALPMKVKTYALPKKITHKLHIEKYGFHGLSHAWAFKQAAQKLQTPPRRLTAVTLHLGSGASMTLWRNGRPMDTTMGFTPLGGLVMSTRSGDIDPAIPLYIQERLGWSARRVGRLLEEHAGLLGLSGLSDMRDVLSAARYSVFDWPHRPWSATDRKGARQALDVYIYHIRHTLAGYLGLISAKAIIFTGPIGENNFLQKMIVHDLPAARGIKRLTVHVDEEQAIVDTLLG